jgi:hypothetical protein
VGGEMKKAEINGQTFTLNDIKLKYRIMGFLSALNNITTGIITSDHTDYDHPRLRRIAFECRLSSVFIDGALWNPNDLFWETVHSIAKDNFDFYNDLKDWTFNNTQTVFSIDKEKICHMEEDSGD